VTTYERHRSLPELRHRKPGVDFTELVEAARIPKDMARDPLIDLQRSYLQLRQKTADLQARNQELEAYAHMVAHDLKDPLAVLVVTSDLIHDIPDLTRQELEESVQQIRTTAYEMNAIINNLLFFAEVGRAEVPLEPVEMARVVSNVRVRLSIMIKERQARIDLPETWPAALGYAPWLEEVWANYFSNALKHAGQPPVIEVGASIQPDGMVRFCMRDNGPGIPLDELDHLFTPFDRIDRICKPGHGLGLSIVRQIVEKLGGQVGVESEWGRGSLFFFTLPGV
jgi:two-component system, sensor histidine kinase and response regulator